MNAQQILTFIQDQVAKATATGAPGISFADLDKYLADLQKTLVALPPETQTVEPTKAQHDFSLAQYNWEKDRSLEMFRSVITTGQSALKACMLLNGGAAVALLAFIGHAASDASTKALVRLLALPLLLFVFGALGSAVAAGVTYLAQALYGSSHKSLRTYGGRVNIAGISVVVTSYALFAWASYSAYQVFLKM